MSEPEPLSAADIQRAAVRAVKASASQCQWMSPWRRVAGSMSMRPGWLTDDEAWRDQLQAMDRDDCHWIEKHWDMAGGKAPAVDTSWITTETVGGISIDSALWPVLFIAVGIVVCFGAGVLFGGGG